MIDLQELRKLAEESMNAESRINNLVDSGVYHVHPSTHAEIEIAFKRYREAVTEEKIIELLDRLEAAEAVCTAVKECLPTIHVMAEWQKVKEGQ